jgi:hypothetical protein
MCATYDRTRTHSMPEMLFKVYARWIPNRTRRDGSALLQRMTHTAPGQSSGIAAWSRLSSRKVRSQRRQASLAFGHDEPAPLTAST